MTAKRTFSTNSSQTWDEPTYVAPRVPVTWQRLPRTDTDNNISKPYVPRATSAPSFEQPKGSEKFSTHHHEYVSP